MSKKEDSVKLTSDMIRGFTRAFLLGRYDNSTGEIPVFHMEMWDLCCSECSKVAIAAPREHAKSTAITFAYVLCCLMLKLKQHVLILSANEQLASQFVNDIKQEILANDALREIFKFRKFLKDSETEIIGLFDDGSKFRVLAKGAEGKMRGTRWELKRPDLVVVDDIEDDEMVLNEERRRKFKEWFYSAVRPILADHGEMRIVGTILHLDSLLENLMPKENAKTTVVTPLKTYSTQPIRGWLAVKYRAHDTRFENILWSQKFSKERLIELREDFEAQGLLDKYNQEYLNDPVDDSIAYFKEDYFRSCPTDSSWLGRPKRYYAACDLAISTSQRANRTAMVVCSLDSSGHLEVEHARAGHWDSKDIIENLFQIQKLYHPDIFTLEKGAIEKSIGPFLRDEMRNRQSYINIIPIAPTGDKMARARSMQGRMRMGHVYFSKDMDWYSDLHEELRKFPRGKSDDYVDAFAYIGLILDNMVLPLTREEELEDEYWEDYRLTGESGRNDITGY